MNPGPFIKPVRASSLRRECKTFEGEKEMQQCPLCGNTLPEKRIYTMDEVRAICKDEKKFAACRDEIHAAQAEGRILKE